MTDGWTQHKSTVKRTSSAISMKSASEGAISVSFVSAPDGVALTGGTSGQRSLNLGTVSNAGGTQTANVQMHKLPGRFVVSTAAPGAGGPAVNTPITTTINFTATAN